MCVRVGVNLQDVPPLGRKFYRFPFNFAGLWCRCVAGLSSCEELAGILLGDGLKIAEDVVLSEEAEFEFVACEVQERGAWEKELTK